MRLGRLLEYKVKGQKIELIFEHKKAVLTVVTAKIINVFCGLEQEQQSSYAIEGDKTVETAFSVAQKADGLWITTSDVQVRVCDDFYVDFFDCYQNVVCEDYRGRRETGAAVDEKSLALLAGEGHKAGKESQHAFDVIKKMQGSEHFYGLGDKTGYLDKRNYDYEMWNTDNPAPHVDCFKALYKSIPFFMTLTDEHVYGIFLDNTYKSFFNMGQESESYFFFGATAGNLDYYYIAGDTMAEVLQGYTYLTGTCPLPQKWTLGYHQSRWGYKNQEDMEDVASHLRDLAIPCDSIHFDIDYMEDYKVFTWNEERYHGNAAAFLADLTQRGFKPIVIIDPGVKQEAGYKIYEEGVEKGYYATTPDGKIYVNAVWPGDSVFPDFGKSAVRKWWGENHKFLLDKGVRGIWNDMNEPASFKGPLPGDVMFSEEGVPAKHEKVHNVYGHLMAKATFEGLQKPDGRRPFVITRACYAGSQKYATAWTGDNQSMWGHLQMAIPQLCNLGLSGMPFVGTDIGGFGADTTKELLIRWVEMGCFSPLFRNHSALKTKRQEPWQFDTETVEIYRKYVQLRYKLIPYLYDLFYEEECTGAPILRPLVFHYEKDGTAQTCNDEFLVGDKILVAPVVQQGMTKRMVYLPEGKWYDYWTGEQLAGNQWLIKDAPLDICPMYVKAGSIIPTMEPVNYVGEKETDTLYLEVFHGKGEYSHYLDNGEDYAYREGKYHKYYFAQKEDGTVTGTILRAGYEKPYKQIVMCICPKADEKPHQWVPVSVNQHICPEE